MCTRRPGWRGSCCAGLHRHHRSWTLHGCLVLLLLLVCCTAAASALLLGCCLQYNSNFVMARTHLIGAGLLLLLLAQRVMHGPGAGHLSVISAQLVAVLVLKVPHFVSSAPPRLKLLP